MFNWNKNFEGINYINIAKIALQKTLDLDIHNQKQKEQLLLAINELKKINRKIVKKNREDILC